MIALIVVLAVVAGVPALVWGLRAVEARSHVEYGTESGLSDFCRCPLCGSGWNTPQA